MDPFAALWCKSNFSFLEGASGPEELVERAHDLGLRALALTDRDGVQGLVRGFVRARELGLPLIAGSEVTVAQTEVGGVAGGRTSVVLLAKDRIGYGNLCRLVSAGRLRCPKGESVVWPREVAAFAQGLVCLWRGGIEPGPLVDAFGEDLFALVARHRRAEEVDGELALRALAEEHGIPTVAANETLYHNPSRRPLQDVLTCIRQGVTIQNPEGHTKPNGEHALLAPGQMQALFEDDVGSIERTLEVAARCAFSLGELRYRYPSERLPDGKTSMDWLRDLTLAGARERYAGEIPAAVQTQVDRELSIIDQLDYPGYFLTMKEIVTFCRQEGILCQGRGSAANSAVCYCLGITAVDPVQMDLLFERFLSVERREPPDIDLDISHERREEVIQHIYAKYGRRHAAMVCNVIRYRMRSAVRDVGKALGIPLTAVDRVARLAHRYDGGDVGDLTSEAGLDREESIVGHFVRLVEEIRGFPRHLSIHPGGFLLGHEPVDTLVPIENGAMEARTVIQWDKDDVDALGLFKVDCLGLGALTLVDNAFALMREHRSIEMDLATIPGEDSATYDMVCEGDTVGVFQIESRAQMAMLPRLRPRNFYDLVIEVSIVRPGPIAGDMVHPYLRRRRGEEPVEYAHPCLEPVLQKTLGVPLFQEQVMKLAVVAADYTPGEADQLRRDMAAWKKSGRIERHRQRLVERMQRKGIDPEFAERVFEQIRGFGEYGFPESHAASFALIAYATAWLKCHHPDVFACALLNAWPMGFYAPSTIIEDARRHDVPVLPVDVQVSAWDCSLEDVGGRWLAIRMGLRYLKGLRREVGERIAERRPYRSTNDLVIRANLDKGSREILAAAGAVEALSGSRRQALWDVWKGARGPGELPLEDRQDTIDFAPLGALEEVAWDYRAGQHSARGHPLEGLRPELQELGFVDADEISRTRHGSVVQVAGLVICRQRPGTAGGVVFLTLEDETGFVNVVVWSQVFERHEALLKTEPFLGVAGEIQAEDNVVHLIARRLWLPRIAPRATANSRNFH